LLPAGLSLLLAACGPSEPADCPAPGELPFSLSCRDAALHCSSEQMQRASLGPLSVSSDAVAVVPWGSGVLRIGPDFAGRLEAQAFDASLFEQGAAVPLLPPPTGAEVVAVHARPLREGAVVVALEQDAGIERFRLWMVQLGFDGPVPVVGRLEVLWEGEHFGEALPGVFPSLRAATDSLLIALDTRSVDGTSQVHFIRADPTGTEAPVVAAWIPPQADRSRLLGVAAAGEEGGLLVAGAVQSGTGETLWIDQFTADFEVAASLWTETSEAAPTSASLIASPDGSSGAFGWFMPSPGEDLLAGLHRLEGIGLGLSPLRTDIWLGPFFGALQGGMVEQALAYEGDQLVQLSLELGPDGAGTGALLGVLRMDAGNTSFNPWALLPLLRIPSGDHRFRAQALPDEGILATLPLLEEDGSHTLGLFRICLPL
jgi:hypothetical protein